MASVQHKRRESHLFQEIATIISEKLENTNIAMATVTDVKLAGDQSLLKVYVTFAHHQNRSFQSLERSKGYVRSQLAKVAGLRKVPRLVFILDKTAAKASKIDAIIAKLNIKKDRQS